MKRIEQRLDPPTDPAAMLEALLESTPDAIKAIDREGRITAYNQRMVEVWALPPELLAEPEESRWERYIASQLVDPDSYLERNQGLRNDRSIRARDLVLHRDGRAFERICCPQHLRGQIIGTMVFWRDITAEHHRQAWQTARDVAERASQAKSAFVGRMSHELRTPLAGVLGLSELLLVDPLAMSDDQQRRVRMVHDAGRHMLQLLDDLLDLSRIEAGELAFHLEPVALQPLFDEVLPQLAVQARQRALQVDVRCADPTPQRVFADRLRLKQVLLNLLSNAVKYNRDGGSVTLELQPDASTLRIDVVDTGNGLTPLQLAALFQPFNRLGQERGRVQGTGLGLVISRALVEQMGGQLQVDSTPEVGSRFSLSLPRV